MMQVRDTQRLKLYRAENEAGAHKSHRFETVKQVDAFVKCVLASKAWDVIVGRHGIVDVTDGRGRRSACARGTNEIRMPVWSRTKQIILHELTHIAINRKHPAGGVAAHGREFAAIYLRLVRRFLGAEAYDKLKAAFIKHNVRYKPKRVMSPEVLASLRERGRLLAAARARPSEGVAAQ